MAGVTVRLMTAAGPTVKAAGLLVIPNMLAVTVALSRPVAKPVWLIVLLVSGDGPGNLIGNHRSADKPGSVIGISTGSRILLS